MTRALFMLAIAGVACLPCLDPAAAQRARAAHRWSSPPVVLPPPAAPAAPTPPPETTTYDPQLMRLAEILGALTHLRPLCGTADAEAWRAQMEALLEAEGTPAIRADRLAGAYNRGLEGYGLSYRTCTPNARIIIKRFLSEGERLARDVGNHYRASLLEPRRLCAYMICEPA